MSGLTYEIVAKAVQQGGMIFCLAVFAVGCAWAFLPRKKSELTRAARIPFEGDE